MGVSPGRIAALVLITVTLVAEVQAAPARKQQQTREREARALFAVGNYQKALDLYGQLFADTLHPTYLRNIGRCQQLMGEPDKAINSFREYLRKAPKLSAQERTEVEGFIAEMSALKATKDGAAPAVGGAANVRGRLIDDTSGAPLVGATVGAFTDQTQSAPARTDAQGLFILPQVPVGPLVRVKLRRRADQPFAEELAEMTIPGASREYDLGTLRVIPISWETVAWAKLPHAQRGFTGIENELRDGKMVISSVRPGTPADRAGLKAGDRVLSIGGKSMDGLSHASRTYYLVGAPGSVVSVVVQNTAGAVRTVELKREAPPAVSSPDAGRPGQGAVPQRRHAQMATAFYVKGQFADALRAFQADYVGSGDPSDIYNIGLCQVALHQHEEALKSFKRYLAEQPNTPHRANIEGRIKRLEELLRQAPPAKTP